MDQPQETYLRAVRVETAELIRDPGIIIACVSEDLLGSVWHLDYDVARTLRDDLARRLGDG